MKYNIHRSLLSLLVSLLWLPVAQADITNNLALYLPLDETSGTTAFDSSTNHNNGTVINYTSPNVPWVANGRIAGAVQMNIPSTTNQYISVPQSSTLDFGTANAFTVSAWVMCSTPASLFSGSSILCKGTGGGFEEYDMDTSAAGASGKFRIVTRNNSAVASTVVATVGPTANFTHVAGVCDCTAHTLKIYINGQLNATTTDATKLTSIRTSSHEVSIGNRQGGTANYSLPFVNGVIDDVHIYGRALSASDIFELYASHGKAPIISAQPANYSGYAGDTAVFSVTVDAVNSVVPVSYQWLLNGTNILNATNAAVGIPNVTTDLSGQTVTVVITNVIGSITSAPVQLTVLPLPAADITNNLVGYYPLDEVAGSTTVADATTNATPGNLIGFTDTTNCWTNGLIAGGLYFNLTGAAANVITVPNIGTPPPPVLDFSATGTFTLAAWVNGTVVQTNGAAVFARGTGNGGEQFTLDLNSGHYRFYVRNASAAVSTATTTVGPNGTWQHVACVINTNKGIMNVYINGLLAGASVAPTSLLSNTHEISIGNRQSGAGAYNLPWTGTIDDVRFYNRDLTSADIQALYLTGGVYPPTLTLQPVGASLYIGDNFKLSAAVGGTAPMFYQWYQTGTLLPGATNTSLTFLPTVATNAGNYVLVATNAYGSITSSVATLQLTPFTPSSALAAYWAFDDVSGSSSAADSSTNGNIGNLLNFPDFTSEWITGRTNGALIFNQAGGPNNEYVDIPNSASLNFSTVSNFSLAAWVRGSPSQANGAGILAKGYGGNNEEYALDVATGVYRFYVRNAASASTALVTAVPPNGQWQHIVATYDGPFTTMKIYVNGVLAASTAAAPPTLLPDNGHDVTIGDRESTTVSGYNLPFAGAIDDVRIYSRALNSNDVQNLYQSSGLLAPIFYTQPLASASLFVGDNLTLSATGDGSAPLTYQWQRNGSNIGGATNTSLTITNAQLADAGTYHLVLSNSVNSVSSSNSIVAVTGFSITNTAAYFALDETNGVTAFDSSSNANTATLIGFPGDDSAWTSGRIGGGLIFNADGSGQTVVTAPDSPSLNFSNTVAFSLAAWVRCSPSQANGAGIIAKGAGGGGEQYALDIHSDLLPARAYRFYVRSAAGASIAMPTTITPNGRWQHLAATFDGNGGLMCIYLNGQLITSQSAPPNLLASTHELSIGNRQSSAGSGYNLPFTGELDDVRIYARALSASEIQSIYALAASFAPVVYVQPQGATKFLGTSVTFTPYVDGSDPLTYQWLKGTNTIPGATGATLTLTNLQISDADSYSLFVTNSLGSVTTAPAVLQVLSPSFSASGTSRLADGTFQLGINGPPNASFTVYATPDVTLSLDQWSVLTTGTFDGSGAATVVDFNGPSNPIQFYRFSVP